MTLARTDAQGAGFLARATRRNLLTGMSDMEVTPDSRVEPALFALSLRFTSIRYCVCFGKDGAHLLQTHRIWGEDARL